MTARNEFINEIDTTSEVTHRQLEELIELQSNILGDLITNDDYQDLLTKLCLFAEKLTSDAVASVMRLDHQQQSLDVLTAPSIPQQAIKELNGLKVGDGSCGNAVYHDEEMYVCDTMTDARWHNILKFSQNYKIHSCWSCPIHNAAKEPIGSFALSSFTTRKPDNFQRRLLNICASIASIILQREESHSDQNKWQHRLRDSNENLAVTVDSIADGVISTDTDNNILIFNPVAERLTGWSQEQAVGKKINEVFKIVNSDGEKLKCDPVKCNDKEKRCYQSDNNLKLHSKDGIVRAVSISEAPIENENGEVSGVVVAFRDITQQRIDRSKLLESQQRYQTLVDNSADAIFLHDSYGRFIDVNHMACESLGYTKEELLTMSVPDVEKGNINFETFKEFTDNLQFNNTYTISGTQQRKDGSQFPVEIRIRKYLSDDEAWIVALARDISERKETETEQLKARKLESIGLLAGGIAHDFNNMLGIIQGYIDLATRSVNQPDKTEKFLQKAYKASSQAADLTQQLLTFSKGGEPIKKTANITEIIHQTTEFNLHGSNVSVEYHFPEDLWPVDIDSGQISQVIQNLTINARQAMSDGGNLAIYCENAVVSENSRSTVILPAKYIKIRLQDNGTGISKANLDSIFDPYFTTKQEGSGLGLALSYSIIKKHNGYIYADSIKGESTTFTLYLPATNSDVVSPERDTGSVEKGTCNARVMIMDDDAMLREVSEEMLENLGYEVIQAEDGETAKNLYHTAMNTGNRIDLIIMDLTIPSGIGGKEAIKRIKEIDPDVKALVSSGYCNDPVMANYEDYGFKGAVRKPYSQDELGDAINMILKQQ